MERITSSFVKVVNRIDSQTNPDKIIDIYNYSIGFLHEVTKGD